MTGSADDAERPGGVAGQGGAAGHHFQRERERDGTGGKQKREVGGVAAEGHEEGSRGTEPEADATSAPGPKRPRTSTGRGQEGSPDRLPACHSENDDSEALVEGRQGAGSMAMGDPPFLEHI
eukprot:CAMPEP_0169483392 /NCGR_PEP_ID=MMETSP1042-20121227/31191_1 /TAXON_ID=464988 /ORGANISM="Hemiselmis andersenii, Strain CCMP1180" /LENGTH=121 /DNA_ID=CAMNT_0009598337 /DNA_START=43 /DNA_END=405 /DNA_ORIENTATION=-